MKKNTWIAGAIAAGAVVAMVVAWNTWPPSQRSSAAMMNGTGISGPMIGSAGSGLGAMMGSGLATASGDGMMVGGHMGEADSQAMMGSMHAMMADMTDMMGSPGHAATMQDPDHRAMMREMAAMMGNMMGNMSGQMPMSRGDSSLGDDQSQHGSHHG